MEILIIRTKAHPKSIEGELHIDGKLICKTLELPFLGNQSDISCIPEGSYGVILRTDNAQGWRIEFTDTKPRTHVQIHPGSYVAKPNPHTGKPDTKGCILVGDTVAVDGSTIQNSRTAYFMELKQAFYSGNASPAEVTIKITTAKAIAETDALRSLLEGSSKSAQASGVHSTAPRLAKK